MRTRLLLLAALVASALPALAANDRIRIANEGQLGDQWSLVPGTRLMPPYPEQYASNPEEVCMVIGYVVNADGTTSDFALLKSWTSGSNSRTRNKFWTEFADLASRAIAQWRYAPRDAASAKPVFTAATFVFGTPQSAVATKEHCEISDLTKRMVELRYDARANRRMSGGIFSRLDIDPALEARLRMEYAGERETQNRVQDAKREQETRASQPSDSSSQSNK